MKLGVSEPDTDKIMNSNSPVTDLLDVDPVYNTNLGAAFNGDSRDLLAQLPDDAIDLVVTSPPFALQHKKEYGNENQGSYNDWFLSFIPEIKRASVVSPNDQTISLSFSIVCWIPVRVGCIWHRTSIGIIQRSFPTRLSG
jgi:hypothetical protein